MKKNSSTAARALTRKAALISSPSPAAPVPRWLRFSPFYIALAVLAVYATAPSLKFIGFDDREIIKQHYFIIGDISKIKLAFTTDAFLGTNGTFCRPLQTVSFMDLDEALRLNPKFADAYQNRGVIKNVLKLFPETLADFNQALKLNPNKNNGGILLGRGISKFYLGDKTGACEDWRMASAHGVTDAAALITEYCKE